MKTSLLLFLIACGGSSEPEVGADAAKVFMDAPPVVSQMIKVSGTASSEGASASAPLAGVVIEFHQAADDAMMATATSAADGTFSFELDTGGSVVDGYLKATKASFVDNYIYPTGPLQADMPHADANMIASSDFSGLGILTGQDSANGFIAAIVMDSAGAGVAGAAISSTPASGKYAYSDSNGYPTGTTATLADGRAFFINAPSGELTVKATKSGMTFKSHALKAHAGALTTTQLTP